MGDRALVSVLERLRDVSTPEAQAARQVAGTELMRRHPDAAALVRARRGQHPIDVLVAALAK